MRPRTLEEYSGQEHLLGPGKPLRIQIERDDSGSMILWGPPGVGKTTLAKIIAETTKASFIEFSAVMSGIKEIKQVMTAPAQASQMHSRTILFVDEIHRFNKAQQDAFLPYVERGTIRLIGATTENPSFEIISALLSRCRVYVLEPLSEERITVLLRRALEDRERGLGAQEIIADEDALQLIASYSSGDCRSAYNTLEVAAQLAHEGPTQIIDSRTSTVTGHDFSRAEMPKGMERAGRDGFQPSIYPLPRPAKRSTSTEPVAVEAVQQRVLMYDKSGEEHYNLISALHKSVRNSDPERLALLSHWLARMFAAGEDPMYLARRVVRMAVEDIGLAAPEALNLCLSAKQAMEFLGSPEGDLALAEAVVYLALAPKIELRLHRLRRGPIRDRAHPSGASPNAPAQRANKADEGARIRQRLSLRPRRRRPRSRHGLPPRLTQGPQLLSANERRPRKTSSPAHGRNPPHPHRPTQRRSLVSASNLLDSPKFSATGKTMLSRKLPLCFLGATLAATALTTGCRDHHHDDRRDESQPAAAQPATEPAPSESAVYSRWES